MGEPEKRPPGQQHHPEVRAGPWASHSDWQAHRPIIAYLYCDRHMTLKEVKETMERQYRFFSTARVYKYRFKQWGLAKYVKHTKPKDDREDGAAETGRSSPSSHRAAASPPSSAAPVARATLARPLMPPGNLRILETCLSQLRAFLRATCGEQRDTARFDPSYAMYLDRAAGAFAVNSAVLEIHRGRLLAGFCKLDASLAHFRHALVAHDTGFPLRLVSTLALLTDSGLPGLDAVFLKYAHHCSCIVLSPAHPFSTITRLLFAASKKRPLDAAWFILAKYSDMLWQCSAPRPALVSAAAPVAATVPESAPGLLELSWDVARSVDREFVVPLATQVGKVAWLPADAFSVAMAVAQIQLAQRLYAAARRTVDNALRTRAGPGAADPLDVALAYRKRWQISRAEGRDRAAVDADAGAFVTHCQTTLGAAHYTTARALEEYEGYLGERRATGVEGEDTPGPDDGPGSAEEGAMVLRPGKELQGKPSPDWKDP